MKIQKKQTGFTLVELVTVVSMLALLTIFVAREMGQSSDDIKENLVITVLASSIPAAISSFRSSNFGNCRASGAGGEVITKDNLMDRGVPENTPWGEDWNFAYDDDVRQITITYNVTGANGEAAMATSVVGVLENNAAFVTDPTSSDEEIIAIYRC